MPVGSLDASWDLEKSKCEMEPETTRSIKNRRKTQATTLHKFEVSWRSFGLCETVSRNNWVFCQKASPNLEIFPVQTIPNH